jgi:hypothetical protein
MPEASSMPKTGPKISDPNKRIIKSILWVLLGSLAAAHIYFFLSTEKILITSGICLYVVLMSILYLLLKLVKKIFRLRYKLHEVRLVLITVLICLMTAETIFILTGYKSTYLERRYKYYYVSLYKPDRQSWYHVWQVDHDLKTDEYCYRRTINSLGLSDIEHPKEKAPGEYRIIGLGDSYTEGDGADKDSTWLKQLERSFSERCPGKHVTFMNAGVCGSDPCYEYILLRDKLLVYKPDLVILAVNGSEIDDLCVRGGMSRFQPGNQIRFNDPPTIEPIYAMSHLSRLLFERMKYDEFLIRKRFKSPLIKEVKNEIYNSLMLFKDLSVKNNFKLLVVYHPFKNEIEDNSMVLQDVLDKQQQGRDIESFNMLDYYRSVEHIDRSSVASYFWQHDGHHNANGYAAFARGIEWKLKNMGITDSLCQSK